MKLALRHRDEAKGTPIKGNGSPTGSGHGEVGGGGASAGSEEENSVRWHWTARGEANRPGMSESAGRREWQTQLAWGATVRTNSVSAARSPAMAETEQGRRATTTTVQAKKGGQEAQGSHDEAFTAPTRRQGRPRCAWNTEEGRRPCSYGGEHCSL